KDAFYLRYIALYEDYVKLDKILTKDTVLLFTESFRLRSVYAPRPMLFALSDLPPGKKVVLLSGIAQRTASLDGYRLGDVIYANPRAIIQTYRTPGRSPLVGSIQVTQLHGE